MKHGSLEYDGVNVAFRQNNIMVSENTILDAASRGEFDVFLSQINRFENKIDAMKLMKSAVIGGNIEICDMVYDFEFHYDISELVWDACKSRQKSSFVWLFDKAHKYDLEELLFVFLDTATSTGFVEGVKFLKEMGIDVEYIDYKKNAYRIMEV
jgi:hypothetical protein